MDIPGFEAKLGSPAYRRSGRAESLRSTYDGSTMTVPDKAGLRRKAILQSIPAECDTGHATWRDASITGSESVDFCGVSSGQLQVPRPASVILPRALPKVAQSFPDTETRFWKSAFLLIVPPMLNFDADIKCKKRIATQGGGVPLDGLISKSNIRGRSSGHLDWDMDLSQHCNLKQALILGSGGRKVGFAAGRAPSQH